MRLFAYGKWATRAVAQRLVTMADMPTEPRDDDLYIVEFPKSGVTWLTFLIANVNLLLSRDPRLATFFNILDFVPDIHVSRELGRTTLPIPGFRIIKSHAQFNPRYRKVFYLLRDPRDVMVSYYAFLTELGWFDGSLEEMLDHPNYGIAAWCRHVSGWLSGVAPTSSFAVIRYEDLVADTAMQVKTLYRLLGIDVSQEILDEAISRSSIEKMREDENFVNSLNPSITGFAFVRKSAAGGARVSLDDTLRARIDHEAGRIMQRLGYSTPVPSG